MGHYQQKSKFNVLNNYYSFHSVKESMFLTQQ